MTAGRPNPVIAGVLFAAAWMLAAPSPARAMDYAPEQVASYQDEFDHLGKFALSLDIGSSNVIQPSAWISAGYFAASRFELGLAGGIVAKFGRNYVEVSREGAPSTSSIGFADERTVFAMLYGRLYLQQSGPYKFSLGFLGGAANVRSLELKPYNPEDANRQIPAPGQEAPPPPPSYATLDGVWKPAGMLTFNFLFEQFEWLGYYLEVGLGLRGIDVIFPIKAGVQFRF
ncbi:MAG: hypothetical protein GMKNLPBB_01469 [Myxococcota bacterium]|nr:hypothetical protein [Myxococcota bacterium]